MNHLRRRYIALLKKKKNQGSQHELKKEKEKEEPIYVFFKRLGAHALLFLHTGIMPSLCPAPFSLNYLIL
jgi:hypothetical protein